jgi:hypothetical protein
MRAYVVTTGVLFVLVVIAHAARLVAEGSGPLHQPIFVGATLAALAVCAWAVALLRRR